MYGNLVVIDKTMSMKRKGEGTKTPIGKALRLQATTAKPSTSSPRNAEIRALFISFKSMFPNTETDYLEEMADELVGKPVATDRFVTELLARDSKPPDFWKPINKAISAALQDDPPPETSKDNKEDFLNEIACPICFEEMVSPKFVMCCTNGHAICSDCETKVKACPVCRESFKKDSRPQRCKFAERLIAVYMESTKK